MGEMLISSESNIDQSRNPEETESTNFDNAHIMDSAVDSDDEGSIFMNHSSKLRKRAISSDDEDNTPKKQHETPEDEEVSSSEENATNSLRQTKIMSKAALSAELDSEEEGPLLQPKPVSTCQEQSKKYVYNRAIFDVDDESDDELNKQIPTDTLPGASQPVKSEDELEEERILSIAKNVHSKKQEKPAKPKKVSDSIARAERQKELATIRSESQRRVRDGPISLPYHRPKQRTLQDFLNRKKKEILPLPASRCGLKMSMRNMEVLRQLEIRKKEAAEFYKSDSDEMDSDEEWKPGKNDQSTDHESEHATENLMEGCPDADDKIGEQADNIASETVAVADSVKQKDQSNITDAAEDGQALSEDCNMDGGETSVAYQSSDPVDVDVEDSNGDLRANCTDRLTEVISKGEDVELPQVTVSSLQNVGGSVKPFDTDTDELQMSMNIIEPSGGNNEATEQVSLNGVTADDAHEVTESLAGAASEEDDDCKKSKLLDDDSCEDKTESFEEEEDEFLTNLDNDASLLKFPESSKPGSRLETQDLLDEDMPQLMLEDGPDDTGTSAQNGRTLQPDNNGSAQLTTSRNPNSDTPHLLNSSSKDNSELGASSTPTHLPPRLSQLVSKLGGSIPMNISPAPRLTPGTRQTEIIDLDDDFATPSPRDPGLKDLMDRFARHSAAKRPLKKPEQVTMSVVSKEKDAQGKEQLVSSSVVLNLEGEQETPLEGCSRPGAKLQRLKAGLQARIHERRVQATREKQLHRDFMETEQVQPDADDPFALPADEEEAELTESSEGESEPELEDDVDMSDKPRTKSKFFDDEAEEDEDDAETESKLEENEIEQTDYVENLEEDEMNANGDATDRDEETSSDDDDIVIRKPVKKSKKESRKSALVLDSDDETEVNKDTVSAPEIPPTSATEVQPAPSTSSTSPVDSLTDPQCSDAGRLLGSDSTDFEALLQQRGSDSEGTPAQNIPAPEKHDEDEDLPDTQPAASPSKTDVVMTRSAESTTRNSSLDDSCSLELQGSCIPAHQPVRLGSRHRLSDLPAGHSSSMGLESMSADLLWCAADNSSSKASNAQFPSSTLLPIADDATDHLAKAEGESQGTFTASQEMRLDFRGVTGSQEQRLDGELPDLLSGTFSGPPVDLPVDGEEDDLGGLTGLCTGRFTGTGVLPGSSTATALPPLTADAPSVTQEGLPDVPLSLAPVFTGEGAAATQAPPVESGCPDLSDTVLLTQGNETQIGISATSELGPENDELLDLCSGDFTDIVSEKKRAACKASLPAGQSKLTHFFTRGPAPVRSKDAGAQTNSLRGSAAVVVAVDDAPTAMKKLPALAVKSTPLDLTLQEGNQIAAEVDCKTDSVTEGQENSDASSSEEEEEELRSDTGNEGENTSKKRRRIVLLDEDDDDDDDDNLLRSSKKEKLIKADEATEDTTTARQEDGSDEESDEEGGDRPRVLVYDDEENEMPQKCPSFKDREKGGIRADFLENEAELSGSDAESDEEEREEDDYMDEEEADKEHYDEEQLREQIGQTHVRGELARDQREVRLLQELYLEDGDLHGEGRQRTFRWKNLDNDDNENNGPAVDSDDAADGEEEEEQESSQWRKERFEREQFLKKKMESEGAELDEEEEEETSIVLGLTNQSKTPSLLKTTSIPIVSKRCLQPTNSSAKSNSPLPVKNPLVLANPENPAVTLTSNPLILARQTSLPSQLSKCGSFLSRGATKLARLASLIKERNDGSQGGAATANASGNFVFQSLTAEEAKLRRHAAVAGDTGEADKKTATKRPASVQPQNQPKKPRLDVAPRGSRSSRSSIFKHL